MKKVSKTGLDLIKKWESLQLLEYVCSAGKRTIGYGHVILSTDDIVEPITEEYANELLANDCFIAEKCIDKYVKVPITSNQFDALTSLIFNIGTGAFKRSRGLVALNENNIEEACKEFFSEEIGFVYVGKNISKGLLRRREDEFKLWRS